jgi:hypothetical protein
MYTQRPVMQKGVTIPQNYAGNAFRYPPIGGLTQAPLEEREAPVEQPEPCVSDRVGQEMTALGTDEKKTALTPLSGHRGGEEDLLLLGILALLLGDGSLGFGGDKTRGDVLFYLLLLLVCG